MRLFADSSALAKRYLREPGRDVVLARCAAADEVLISFLAPIEVVSALNRLRRAARLTDEQYEELKKKLTADAQNATVVLPGPSVEAGAFRCLESAPLRASDAVHVASALECRPDLFLTGDRRQHEAAKGMGLKVEFVGEGRRKGAGAAAHAGDSQEDPDR